jgi:hypothetical protein
MLTIVDLHQNEELSSSDMGKVAGGVCDAGAWGACSMMSLLFKNMGCDEAAGIMQGTANGAVTTCPGPGGIPY